MATIQSPPIPDRLRAALPHITPAPKDGFGKFNTLIGIRDRDDEPLPTTDVDTQIGD